MKKEFEVTFIITKVFSLKKKMKINVSEKDSEDDIKEKLYDKFDFFKLKDDELILEDHETQIEFFEEINKNKGIEK